MFATARRLAKARYWSRPLPDLTQGSTLTLTSSKKAVDVAIRSAWRDDGDISCQIAPTSDSPPTIVVRKVGDKITSMNRPETHISVAISDEGEKHEEHGATVIASTLADGEESDEPWRATDSLPTETEEDQQNSLILLNVPEKINIDCQLLQGGRISIESKIEGDVNLYTADGDIRVTKLRGHGIDISAHGPGNSIFSSDLLEAQKLNITLPNGGNSMGRLRAKRIHAGTVNVQIGGTRQLEKHEDVTCFKFDNDDNGAVCDISSLYLSNEAHIQVSSSAEELSQQLVRIKSHHGPAIVDATGPAIGLLKTPIVELGGVNGSCEVSLKKSHNSKTETNEKSAVLGCQVHFDSITPDSVSVVDVEFGNVALTVDRKVESDVRLLSAKRLPEFDINDMLGDNQEPEEYRSMIESLSRVDEESEDCAEGIEILTGAFTGNENGPTFKRIHFVDGWLENKSEEPDSRFDRKVRGTVRGGQGKINLEGAASQALDRFQGDGQPVDKSSVPRPLVAAASPGKITIETLSWLGNIARRYGVNDATRQPSELGRTATRRGRSLHPQSEQ